MVETHPLILSLRSAGLKDLDPCNIGEVHNMWHAFSKAKHCIDGGDRYEYLSWRIYSREVLLRGQSKKAPNDIDIREEIQAPIDDTEFQDSSTSEEELGTDDDESVTSDSDRDDQILPKMCHLTGAALPELSINYDHAHRRLSSIELQSLFDDKKQPIQLNGTSNSFMQRDHAEIQTQPYQTYSPSERSKPIQQPQEVEDSPNDEGDNNQISKTSTDRIGSLPSSIVRGFSPSHISVSVSNKQSSASPSQSTNNFMIKPNLNHNTQKSDKLESSRNDDSREKPSSKKMFYICEGDSDTESSSDGSPTISNVDSNGRVSQRKKVLWGPSKHADVDERINATACGNDTSEWDDTSDEEEDFDDESEHHKQDLFQERAVPTKPLLKRSLLSTLFVNQAKNHHGDSDKGMESKPDDSPILAPVDILLGAPLAPHFPLPTNSNSNAAGDVSDTDSIGTNASNQADQFNSRSLEDDRGLSTNIKSRPEMYRASTDIRERRRSTHENDWTKQHEDIYDPMNYHSRGW